MKKVKLTEKQKVINRIVKWGSNVEDATRHTEEHYEYVSRYYTGISKMAEVILSL